jgi:hypothetical protein
MSASQHDSPPKPPEQQRPAAGKRPAKADADRLAAALRDNLKRRKAQARARRDAGSGGREG